MNNLIKTIIEVSKIASKDATRYHLGFVRLEKISDKRMKVVACDGHRLVVRHVNGDDFKAMPKISHIDVTTKGNLDMLKGAFKSGNITLTDMKLCGIALEYINIKDSYPNYNAVIPKDKGELSIAFNSKYIADLVETLKFSNKKIKTIKLTFKDKNSPITVTTNSPEENDCEDVTLLMPCRL